MECYSDYERAVLLFPHEYPKSLTKMLEWIRECREGKARVFGQEVADILDKVPNTVKPYRLLAAALLISQSSEELGNDDDYRPDLVNQLLKVLKNEI